MWVPRCNEQSLSSSCDVLHELYRAQWRTCPRTWNVHSTRQHSQREDISPHLDLVSHHDHRLRLLSSPRTNTPPSSLPASTNSSEEFPEQSSYADQENDQTLFIRRFYPSTDFGQKFRFYSIQCAYFSPL